MFANLIFLVIVLLLISFAPMANGNDWMAAPSTAFLLGMGAYAILLAAIYTLPRTLFKRALYRHRGTLFIFVNLALIAFLALYHFILSGHRAFPNSTALIALFSLALYFLGLLVFSVSTYPYIPASTRGVVKSAWDYGGRQLRLVFPFAIPFLLLSLIMDVTTLFPESTLQGLFSQQGDDIWGIVLLFGLTILFLVVMMIFFPPLVQLLWRCKPLKDRDLLARLERLCARAHFRHAGIKTWTVMNHAFTAGIVGLLPRFRYVMFTQRLLDEMPPECLEAILAHEIGHSYRRHLLVYPFILFGMMVCAGILSLFFSESIDEFFWIQHLLNPSQGWKLLYPFMIFIPYALIIAIYFRFVFGYFSRLFERQADLHVFELNIPPEHLEDAFDRLGKLTGHTHHEPSWHHYSIHKRIKFLAAATEDHTLITKHHRRVKQNLFLYFNLLALACLVLVAPLMPDITPFHQVTTFTSEASRKMSDWMNGNLGTELAEKYMSTYQLKGNRETIMVALKEGVQDYATLGIEGVVEYVAAKALYAEGEVPASIKLLTVTWNTFDLSLATPGVIEEFSSLTEIILQEHPGTDTEALKESYRSAIERWNEEESNDTP